MKSVLISIKPKWCKMIADGKKTVEVRKTRPKIETPFKCYIYSSKDKWEHLVQNPDKTYEIYNGKDYGKYDKSLKFKNERNGKVIGEFFCDKIDIISHYGHSLKDARLCIIGNGIPQYISDAYTNKVCLSLKEMEAYSKGRNLYGYHISNFILYDNPKELSEFGLKRPPQSWCYVKEI